MKVCTTCGAQWPDETKFCPNDGSTLRSTASADVVGSVIADRYHILKKLGEGGMGAVYLGEHVKMGRKSAIKIMAQSMANDPDAIARFNREAANAARINHPHVCAIYDFGETKDGLIYLAMEFIEGEALTDLIEREGALPPRRAARIIQQAGDALQAAHDLGIVHRDLKPDNIMITRGRDGADVVKVVDFGIAKAMGGEEGQKVTKTGLVVGTPEYMSPEQLAGDKLDGRSDIYSLALVLYRMVTGTLPFVADTAQEMMIKRLTDDPLPLNQARPDGNFPPRLQDVMTRALMRMPSGRYASAAEFARDVAQAVAGMADVAAADTQGATQLISSVSTAATAQVPRTRVSGRDRVATPDTPAPAAATRAPAPTVKKKKPVAAIAAAVGVLAVGGGAAAVMLSGRGAAGGVGPDTSGARPVAVTGDTAPPAGRNEPSQPSGGRQQTSTTRQQVGTDPQRERTQTDPVVTPVRAAVDSLAIDRDLEAMIDQIFEDATRPSARGRAQGYYDNSQVPVNLRASAAFTVAQSFFIERNATAACSWNARALALVPNNEQYLKFKRDQGCP